MKIFFLSISGFFLVIIFGIFLFTGLAGWSVAAIQAKDYTPLDFISDYDRFEITVGFDQVNGRYATYHYEFME